MIMQMHKIAWFKLFLRSHINILPCYPADKRCNFHYSHLKNAHTFRPILTKRKLFDIIDILGIVNDIKTKMENK